MSDLPAATAAVTELVGRYSITRDEMAELLTGTIDGGNGDGYYPVTVADGTTQVLVPCPRRLALLAGGIEGLISGGSLIAAVADRSYEKYAGLAANLAVGPGAWGVVYADADSKKNGFWVKFGAAGTGYWTLKVPLAETLASTLANFTQDVPIGNLIQGERPLREVRNAAGKLIEATTAEGSVWINTPSGMRRVGAEVANAAPLGPLVGNETPVFVETNQDGVIVKIDTVEGGRWVATPAGLVRTTAARSTPTRYAGAAFVQGIDQVARASTDTALWYLLVTLGQSNAMGQNTASTDAIAAAIAKYPNNAWMFEGGPRRDDALPNRKIVPLVESDNGIGQKETEASGWANHFIRDVEAATGVRPNTLSIVTALGSQPYMALSRGTATYTNFLRAIDDAVAAIRAAGGTRIVTVFSWTQGPSDASGVGFMNTSRRVREMQQAARQFRGDVMERTGEVEPPLFVIVNETSQPFADPWYGPVRDADQLLDGDDHMRLAGGMYHLPYSDMYHATCLGQNRKGQMVARACIAEMFAQGWRPVRPVRSRWESGTQFVVDFDMAIPPLVLDTSGAVVSVAGLAALGFLFDDSSGASPAITNIEVVPSYPYPGMALRFTLATMPTGPRARLGYAIQRDASQSGDYPGQAGPVTGPRGLLRDSAAHVSLYDGKPQANWAPPFVIEL